MHWISEGRYMNGTTQVKDCLIEYLKHEGFYDGIPKAFHPKRTLWNIELHVVWIAWIVLSCIYILLVLVVALGLGAILALVIGTVAIGFGLSLVSYSADSNNDLGMWIGAGICWVSAISLVFGGWPFYSPLLGLMLLPPAILGLCLLPLAHVVNEAFRAVWKVSYASLSILPLIGPALLFVVLLSVFTQELWQILSIPTISEVFGIGLFIICPGFVLIYVSARKEARNITSHCSNRSVLANTARNFECIQNTIMSRDSSINDLLFNEQTLPALLSTESGNRLLKSINRRIIRWFVLFIAIVGVVLVLALFGYFFVLLNFLLKQPLIESMLSNVKASGEVYNLIGYQFDSASVTIIKACIFLSLFIAGTSGVHVLTNEDWRRNATDWLKPKAEAWLAASLLIELYNSPVTQTTASTPMSADAC